MDAPFSGQFKFEVDGVQIGAFTEVSGLEVEVEVEEIAEGGENQFVHKLAGRMKWPNIVLKRGITESDGLLEWLDSTAGQVTAGARMTRNTGRIAVVNAKREEVRNWEFVGAFPVRWRGPSLAASSHDVATEELEIAHHGFRRA